MGRKLFSSSLAETATSWKTAWTWNETQKKKMYIANKAMDHDKSLAYRSNRIIAVLPVFFSPFIYVF